MTASGTRNAYGLLAALGTAVVAFAPRQAAAQAYLPAPPALNARAERQLRALFTARTRAATAALFSGELLICGPFLWRNLATRREVAGSGIEFTSFIDTGSDPRHISLTGGAS